MLNAVRNMISKYDVGLGGDESENTGKFRRLYLKLHWRVATKKKVAVLETRLSNRLMGLSMRIPLSLYRAFLVDTQRVLGSISPRPGYTSDNAVTIVDALGKHLTWPMAVCKPWKQFQASLEHHFKGKFGEEFVMQGNYGLYSDNGKALIRMSDWDTTVTCGMTIEMSMVVRHEEKDKYDCPFCGHWADFVREVPWFDCPRCEKQFKVTYFEDRAAYPEDREGLVSPDLERKSGLASCRQVL
ncbi:hypothetical protein FA95DRAFT_666243 [Auriscalpium vulgare]|uniref:Uncharacterized protein n=1 Tax=Auriscalpium vulgare TaxID=40419 RepID=A0ACB8S1D0_9AGAM|nr:hypothetical protein FA95DRAFT_666243 [Auriscalpium vulgare]